MLDSWCMACIAVKGWTLTSAACISLPLSPKPVHAWLMKEQRSGETERSGGDVQWIAVAQCIVLAKYKAYFHFRSTNSYSIVLLFCYSVFCILQCPSIYSIRSGESLSVDIRTERLLRGETGDN